MPLLAGAAVVLTFAGCAFGGDSASVEADELDATVLHSEDLPRVFVSFDEGPLQVADAPRGESGWKARYRRSGSPDTSGPLVIESRVDRVIDEEAAAQVLAAQARRLRADGGWSEEDVSPLGAESFAFRQREEAVNAVDYFVVVWREANVVASLTISGFAGKVRLGDAVELARKQQRRVDAAA